MDKGLFYPYVSLSVSTPNGTQNNTNLIDNVYASYLSDSHKAHSQSGYLLIISYIKISQRSWKQTLVSTSTNHSEVLALYEANRECVWIGVVIGYIRSTYDFAYDPNEPFFIYEDNTIIIDLMKHGHIKGENIKHVFPKLLFTCEQQRIQRIKFRHIKPKKNHADF